MAREGGRKPIERSKHTKRATELRLRGLTLLEIAEELGISEAQVCRDLQKVEARWRNEAVGDVTHARAVQLARMRNLEKEYWKGWDDSRKDAKRSEAQKSKAGEKSSERAKQYQQSQYGDPRFLDGITTLIKTEIQLYGLNMPVRVAATNTNGEDIRIRYTDLGRIGKALALLDDLRARGATQADR